MKLRDLPRTLDLTQQSRWFKISATVLLVLIVGGLYTWYAVAVESGQFGGAEQVLRDLGQQGASAGDDPRLRIVRGVLSDASSTVSIGVVAAAVVGVGTVMIWLGLGLTYLLLALVAAAIALPLSFFEATEVYARVLFGVVTLAASFTALMQALRTALSGAGPVLSVARNMLTEAVRMKISLVLIIILMLGLAVLPGLLDQEQPLRYRVQSFFQYSVSGTFWILAVLTLAFGVASITGEQRDKTIWQTVTKPVAAWQYLLGKWIGLAGLNAILLLVCASGVFLFAEYLRNQPAVGERAAYISDDAVVTEDRFILETRVLTARRSRFLEVPAELSVDSPEFQERVEQYIASERLIDPEFASTPQMREKVVEDLHESALRAYRSIPNGDRRVFRIPGLAGAKDSASPITFSIRVDALGNRPDLFYTLSIIPLNQIDAPPIIKKMGLGYYHNISLSPEAINDDGVLEVMIWNGEIVQSRAGSMGVVPNQSTVSIPDQGIEVFYQAGGYRTNFMRVILVLWVKLAFLAMIAIFASTFLSFPVACLVAFGMFLLAEMSGFLGYAAETYSVRDAEGAVVWYKVITVGITDSIASLFGVYSDLKPVRRLVDGRLLPWGNVAGGTGILAVASAVLFALSVVVFRRRELATYSGQ